MKRLLLVLVVLFSTIALPAAAENAALAEEAKQLLVQAGNLALEGETNPRAMMIALEMALEAKKKWAQSEAKDTEFEEIMENVVDALSASHYMVNALMFKTKGDERGFETALENACTH